MQTDPPAARTFLTANGRELDRLRFEHHLGAVDPSHVLRALDTYRNDDGGYGWGLEPDLRCRESQPAAAMHALEVLAEVAPAHGDRAVELCAWLDARTLADGGLPFALPIGDPTGCAPFWVDADAATTSLMMTAQVAANAHRIAPHDPPVAAHPWLTRATRYCLDAIAAIETAPHAYELLFALRFLDAVAAQIPEADALLDQLGDHVPASGRVHVEGGTEEEALYPLDLSPRPDAASRRLFSDEVVAADLARVAGGQQRDGGWSVDFQSYSPRAALDWRGYATVSAVMLLEHHDA